MDLPNLNNSINGVLNLTDSTDDKILVYIHLFGGNDGLNTIIPLDQYQNLFLHRKNILISEKKILKSSSDTLGFHPAIKELRDMFDDGYMSIIQNVGYPEANRSHFKSTNIWNTGSPSSKSWTSGWLGRYFDILHKNYPVGYPNELFKDPLSINIDKKASDTSQGINTNYSFALDNLSDFNLYPEYQDVIFEDKGFNDEFSFISSTIKLTNKYTDRIKIATEKGTNLYPYKESSKLSQDLKIVARLISGGLKTRFYSLRMDGYDTHGSQTVDETDKGIHSNLLRELSMSMSSFFNDLKKQNLMDKVLIAVSTEFGRQIKSNESKGTDHGAAAPMFLFGSNLKNTVVGNNPVINKKLKPQEAIDYQIDFRDIYSTILFKWFNAEEKVISEVFSRDFKQIEIL